jgi:drug/metabolite transporter (DMT)-like permease
VTSTSTRGIAFGLVAAVSFGVSAPLAKLLLDDASPQLLAGLLYLGAFAALGALGALDAFPRRRPRREAPLQPGDVPRLVVLVVAGGIVAPVLLLVGLERVSGVTGSLLLNLEGPFTIAVGVSLFGEHLSRRGVAGATVIFSGALLLGLGGATRADWVGIVCIAAACAAWALDNNLTQSLTVRDPRAIVRIKVGVAGAVNFVLALLVGATLPRVGIVAAALALGAVSYGASVYFDALALRDLGAAREAAVFAVAPFVGALVAPLVLPETIGAQDAVAGALMATGLVLLLRERHSHVHRHEPLVHEHLHTHDEHHRHEHAPGVAVVEPHGHLHRHEELVHAHEHVSDIHHRHSHRSTG